jgi:hypothetical protein
LPLLRVCQQAGCIRQLHPSSCGPSQGLYNKQTNFGTELSPALESPHLSTA